MADDARTEAQRRIAQAIARYDWNHGISANATPGEHAYGEADAILALFPSVEWQPWCMSHAIPTELADRSDCEGLGPHDEGRQLVLHGPIDDLAYEEATDA
jgi:hypothetical protein